jgi:hypothetical protein
LRRLFLELPNINGDLETGSGISCRKYSSSKTSRKYANLYFSFDGIDRGYPPGVVNIVNGFGAELGRALVTNKSIAAFTGSTPTGRLVMQYATENIIPVTLELGGKSPNIFMKSVGDRR